MFIVKEKISENAPNYSEQILELKPNDFPFLAEDFDNDKLPPRISTEQYQQYKKECAKKLANNVTV